MNKVYREPALETNSIALLNFGKQPKTANALK